MSCPRGRDGSTARRSCWGYCRPRCPGCCPAHPARRIREASCQTSRPTDRLPSCPESIRTPDRRIHLPDPACGSRQKARCTGKKPRKTSKMPDGSCYHPFCFRPSRPFSGGTEHVLTVQRVFFRSMYIAPSARPAVTTAQSGSPTPVSTGSFRSDAGVFPLSSLLSLSLLPDSPLSRSE